MIRISISHEETHPENEEVDETQNETQNETSEETSEDAKFNPETATADEIREFGERSAERTRNLAALLKLSIVAQEAGFDIQTNVGEVETVVIPKPVAEQLVDVLDVFEAATAAAIERAAEAREKETTNKK